MSAEQITKLAEEIISSTDDLWPSGLSDAEEIALLGEMIRLKREAANKDAGNRHSPPPTPR